MKNTKHGKEPATTKSDAKPEKAFGLDQGWGVVILAVALMCLGGAVSYFGGKPQILYIAAFGICLLVFYGTHRLVASELKSLALLMNSRTTLFASAPKVHSCHQNH